MASSSSASASSSSAAERRIVKYPLHRALEDPAVTLIPRVVDPLDGRLHVTSRVTQAAHHLFLFDAEDPSFPPLAPHGQWFIGELFKYLVGEDAYDRLSVRLPTIRPELADKYSEIARPILLIDDSGTVHAESRPVQEVIFHTGMRRYCHALKMCRKRLGPFYGKLAEDETESSIASAALLCLTSPKGSSVVKSILNVTLEYDLEGLFTKIIEGILKYEEPSSEVLELQAFVFSFKFIDKLSDRFTYSLFSLSETHSLKMANHGIVSYILGHFHLESESWYHLLSRASSLSRKTLCKMIELIITIEESYEFSEKTDLSEALHLLTAALAYNGLKQSLTDDNREEADRAFAALSKTFKVSERPFSRYVVDVILKGVNTERSETFLPVLHELSRACEANYEELFATVARFMFTHSLEEDREDVARFVLSRREVTEALPEEPWHKIAQLNYFTNPDMDVEPTLVHDTNESGCIKALIGWSTDEYYDVTEALTEETANRFIEVTKILIEESERYSTPDFLNSFLYEISSRISCDSLIELSLIPGLFDRLREDASDFLECVDSNVRDTYFTALLKRENRSRIHLTVDDLTITFESATAQSIDLCIETFNELKEEHRFDSLEQEEKLVKALLSTEQCEKAWDELVVNQARDFSDSSLNESSIEILPFDSLDQIPFLEKILSHHQVGPRVLNHEQYMKLFLQKLLRHRCTSACQYMLARYELARNCLPIESIAEERSLHLAPTSIPSSAMIEIARFMLTSELYTARVERLPLQWFFRFLLYTDVSDVFSQHFVRRYRALQERRGRVEALKELISISDIGVTPPTAHRRSTHFFDRSFYEPDAAHITHLVKHGILCRTVESAHEEIYILQTEAIERGGHQFAFFSSRFCAAIAPEVVHGLMQRAFERSEGDMIELLLTMLSFTEKFSAVQLLDIATAIDSVPWCAPFLKSYAYFDVFNRRFTDLALIDSIVTPAHLRSRSAIAVLFDRVTWKLQSLHHEILSAKAVRSALLVLQHAAKSPSVDHGVVVACHQILLHHLVTGDGETQQILREQLVRFIENVEHADVVANSYFSHLPVQEYMRKERDCTEFLAHCVRLENSQVFDALLGIKTMRFDGSKLIAQVTTGRVSPKMAAHVLSHPSVVSFVKDSSLLNHIPLCMNLARVSEDSELTEQTLRAYEDTFRAPQYIELFTKGLENEERLPLLKALCDSNRSVFESIYASVRPLIHSALLKDKMISEPLRAYLALRALNTRLSSTSFYTGDEHEELRLHFRREVQALDLTCPLHVRRLQQWFNGEVLR